MSLRRGTLCTNCEKEHKCAEAERMFKSGSIAYGCSACVPKAMTNADRIRAMSDEELAEWMNDGWLDIAISKSMVSTEQWLEWLRKEAK